MKILIITNDKEEKNKKLEESIASHNWFIKL
jgi:hypothetical protein